MKKINNKSPLRYPGGKTRACKIIDEIANKHFKMNKFNVIVSPFFGGGSFEFYLQNKYEYKIIANDKFKPLYKFWIQSKQNNDKLTKALYKLINTITKEKFKEFRNKILNEKNNDFVVSIMYFVINRCSFSGSTLSGGFSDESSKKRFTISSIDRIKELNLSKFEISNKDFIEFINELQIDSKQLIFLDPPYYLGSVGSKLYGNNGDMHENFNHQELFNCISKRKNWILTYNNCDYIKKLYKKFKIIETNWSYGMNKSKESSEIIIIG